MAKTNRRKSLTIEVVKTIDQALIIALVRNECCKWMTGNQKVIDVGQQEKFFKRLTKSHEFCAYLFRFNGNPCGYGIMRFECNEVLLTIGLAKHYRNRGLGAVAIRLMMGIFCDYAIKLSVLKSNRRAIRLYKKLGFKIVRKTRKQLHMRHENDTTP